MSNDVRELAAEDEAVEASSRSSNFTAVALADDLLQPADSPTSFALSSAFLPELPSSLALAGLDFGVGFRFFQAIGAPMVFAIFFKDFLRCAVVERCFCANPNRAAKRRLFVGF